MKKIWCPETATKAYLDTLKSMKYAEDYSGAPEYISAMAGGWKARFIVEVWSAFPGGVAKSIALAMAARHSGGRHVCILANEKARAEYISAMQSKGGPHAAGLLPEVVVGRAEEVVERLKGVDFMVFNGGSEEFSGKICNRRSIFGLLGAVVVVVGNSKKRVSRVFHSEDINVVKSSSWKLRADFCSKANLIDEVCSTTPDPNLCKSSFRSDSRSAGADLHILGQVAIDLAKPLAISASSLIKDLGGKVTNRNVKLVYEACLENYNSASYDLNEAVSALKNGDYHSLNSRAGAILDWPVVCDENFPPSLRKDVPTPLTLMKKNE